jgi:putative serine protease PepD
MSMPTLEVPPPATNGAAGPGRRPPRAPRLALIASALLGAGLLAVLLLAVGAIGGSTNVTKVVNQAGTTTGAAKPALDAAAVYSSSAAGVVDITARGVSATPDGSGSGTASGTGFLIDAQGHVLTADHVVTGASSITVRFQDGTTRTANVVGTDSSTDAAVLSINPSGLTLHPLTLGSSRSLAVGDALAVIGDPFQYDRSLSTGVVSALDRTIQAPNGFTVAHAIQTDAALNPGNSGGPVLGANGRVVGIADQIATGGSSTESYTGVGFAVPIDVVKGELSQLEHGATVRHAYLGVSSGDAPNASGALVESVVAGGPADSAGLRGGDVVTAIGGATVSGSNDVIAAVASHRPGDRVALTVQRGASKLTVTVTLGTQPRQAPNG